MDDQDVQDWGGPTSVRQEFTDQRSSDNQRNKAAPPLDSLLQVPRPLTIGPRLLRHLGWREGAGAAFVSTAATGQEDTTALGGDPNVDHSKIQLSQRKLRQIELQSTRIKMPPTKLDRCGLGFEALEKAPEFQRYRQQRHDMARARARGQSNVYRISDLVEGDNGTVEKESSTRGGTAERAEGSQYLSYETAEDFVGTRSSGGFALRDDEDDAYDPMALGGDRNTVKPSAKRQLLSEDYHDEVVDIDEDSDVDNEGDVVSLKRQQTVTPAQHTDKEMNSILGGALASWAGKKDTSSQKIESLTASGRPPLPGFRLGSSVELHRKRYPGPDVPRDYQLKRHVFSANERPAILQTVGRAIQLEGEEKKRQAKQHTPNVVEKGLHEWAKRSEQPLLSGNHFLALANNMKSRFTTASESAPGTSDDVPKAGLYLPNKVQKKSNDAVQTHGISPQRESTRSPKVAVKRSTLGFVPLPLVCKRFGVSAPRHSARGVGQIQDDARVTEALYFEKEVMPSVQNASADKGVRKDPLLDAKAIPTDISTMQKDFAGAGLVEDPRPSKQELKAIFAPDSDDASSSSADTDLDSVDPERNTTAELDLKIGMTRAESQQQHTTDAVAQYESREIVRKNNVAYSDSDGDSDSGTSSSHRKRKRSAGHKRRKKHRKKKKRSRHPPGDADDSLDGDSDRSMNKKIKRGSRERREKDSRKHRKKHSKARKDP